MKDEDYQRLKSRLEGDFFLVNRPMLKHWIATIGLLLAALGFGGFAGAWKTGRAGAREWMESKEGKDAEKMHKGLVRQATDAAGKWSTIQQRASGVMTEFGEEVKRVKDLDASVKALPTFLGFDAEGKPFQVYQGKQSVGRHGRIQPQEKGYKICFRSDCQPTFSILPTLLAIGTFDAANEGTSDVFTVQAKHITPSYFYVDWRRLDADESSGGGLTINWIAIGPK